MMRYKGSSVGLFVVVLLILLLLSPGTAMAEETRFAPDAEIREAFDAVVLESRASVVELSVDGKKRVLGTIVEVDEDTGYVLSKASELVKGESITAVLSTGRKVVAKLVGVDRKNDLAMLQIKAPRLKAVELVERDMGLGRWVACVGQTRSPGAVGIVSAKARSIKPPQLMLGVALREDPRGLRVEDLVEDFGAAAAGMRVGDVLTRIEEKKVIAVQQLVDRLQVMAEGDKVAIQVLRNGESIEMAVELSEYEPDPRSRAERMNRMGGALSERRRGFEKVLQHDAEIQPEACGGPLVNLKGEVIGLNIARAGRIATYALPSSLLKEKIVALKSGKLAPTAAGPEQRPVKAQPELEVADAGN